MTEPVKASDDIRLRPPWKVELSDKVTATYGFRDARVEVEIQLPKPYSAIKKSVTIKLTAEEVKNLFQATEKAVLWAGLSAEQLQRDGAE